MRQRAETITLPGLVPRGAASCFKRNRCKRVFSVARAKTRRGIFKKERHLKRYGNLYSDVITLDALRQGFYDARRSKSHNYACWQFELSLGTELLKLHKELTEGTYKPRPYMRFKVYEPKERIIYAPAFRDCVVQHAIYSKVQPVFDRTFIHTSFACRVGKGTHAAADYAQEALIRSEDGTYTLQLDIRKFFYRIDRQILRFLIERKIKDPQLVDLMMQFAEYEEPIGIPIGNLLSQLYALIYLNPIDHYIVRQLRPSAGYCRYVDDFILFGITRGDALLFRDLIIGFLDENLNLELSRSTIATVSRGVNFVGYRTYRRARFIRKHSLYKARKAMRRGHLERVISHLAHARKTHSLQHLLDYCAEHNYELYCLLPEKCKSTHYRKPESARGQYGALRAA